jgi:hypothetical protein
VANARKGTQRVALSLEGLPGPTTDRDDTDMPPPRRLAAISRPKAVPAITRTGYPCGPPHPRDFPYSTPIRCISDCGGKGLTGVTAGHGITARYPLATVHMKHGCGWSNTKRVLEGILFRLQAVRLDTDNKVISSY